MLGIWGFLLWFQGGVMKKFYFHHITPYNKLPRFTGTSAMTRLKLDLKSLLIRVFLPLALLMPMISEAAIPPPSSEVFSLSAERSDPNLFQLTWQIKTGYFLYQKRIHVTPDSTALYDLGVIKFPPPDEKVTPQGTSEPIYRNRLTLAIPILGHQGGEALLTVNYQGCSDAGFCYPPQQETLKITIDAQHALMTVTPSSPLTSTPQASSTQSPSSATPMSEEQQVFEKSWGIVLLTFFGFGVLLAFTPCILPMIPVLSSIIVGHKKQLSTLKAFGLSLSYVLSMSITYSAVGALVALMGSNLQVLMQSPWTITLFSGLFVLLALSMLDVYELKLPISWQSKLANVTRNQTHGHYLNAAIMGSLSILILSPCITPPLIGALGYIAQSGDVTLGSLALFFLGLGMGLPLLLVGASLGKFLPKAGRWMNTIKVLFGLILIGMAIYLMGRILPQVITMSLWAGLLIFTGLYLGALRTSDKKLGHFKKGLGLIAFIYGILILIGAAQGGNNPLKPLILTQNKAPFIHEASSYTVVTNIKEIQRAFSANTDKPLLLDFYADWCASCKTIEATTLRAPSVLKLLQQFTVLKVDLTKNDADSRAIMRHFDVVAPPTFLFFDKQQKLLPQLKLVGNVSQEIMLNHLNSAGI